MKPFNIENYPLYVYEKDIVKILLDTGTNINVRDYAGDTVLTRMVTYSARKVVTQYDRDGHLTFSELRDTEGFIRMFIAYGVDVNAQNDKGETALIRAIRHRNLGAIKLLLEHNVDIDIKDNGGNSAMSLATYNHEYDMIDMLKAHIKK